MAGLDFRELRHPDEPAPDDPCARFMAQEVHFTAKMRRWRDRDQVRVAELDESQLEVRPVEPDRSVDAAHVPHPPRPECQAHECRGCGPLPCTSSKQWPDWNASDSSAFGVRPVEHHRVRVLFPPEAHFRQRITADAAQRAGRRDLRRPTAGPAGCAVNVARGIAGTADSQPREQVLVLSGHFRRDERRT